MELVLNAEKMKNYLPLYWHEYDDMMTYLKALGADIDMLDKEKDFIITDAFIMQMSEPRIEEWEKWLDLPPNGTLYDRRLAILAYFAVISKMTRESIQTLVYTLYNEARSEVTFKNSTIKIVIKPLPNHSGDELDFNRLLSQLNSRKPCHISLTVQRWFNTWGDIKANFSSWQDLKNKCTSWQEVYNYIPD